MLLLARQAVVLVSLTPVAGCAGRVAPQNAPSKQEGTSEGEAPVSAPVAVDDVPDALSQGSSIPDSSIEDAYGARFLGDADQCAAIVCSGSQVCCVVPIPSDAPTPHPNNKCDYDCIAQCMDSCPVISLGPSGAASPSEGTGAMHGGPVVLPMDDAGLD